VLHERAIARFTLIEPSGSLVQLLKHSVADRDGSRAVNRGVFRHHAVVERGERDDRLEGRGRRVGGLEGAAVQRRGGILVERLVIRIADAGDEAVEVERWPRGHHEHLAGDHVDHHEGSAAAALAERLLGEQLPLEVERRDERATRARALDLLFEQLVAVLVEKQFLHAGVSGELR
jgi:hypothetical protein